MDGARSSTDSGFRRLREPEARCNSYARLGGPKGSEALQYWFLGTMLMTCREYRRSIATPPLVTAVLAALAVVLSPGSSGAQAHAAIDLTPSCEACRLSFDTVATMSALDERAGPLATAWGVATDAAGRFWVAFGSAAPLNVYSQSGQIERIVRQGEGPGEAIAPQAVVAVGDSMAVFDSSLGRVTIFGPGLDVVRTFSVQAQGTFYTGLALEWPNVVLNGFVPTPDGIGHPLHVLDMRTGRLTKSFGASDGGNFDPRDRSRLVLQLLAGNDPSHFFTVQRTEFAIKRWSTSGELLEALEAAPDWFPPGGRGSAGSPRDPPEPDILSALKHGSVIFATVHLPADDWQRAWRDAPEPIGPHGGGRPPREALYDYWVFAIDLEDRRLVNRWPVEDPFRPNTRLSGLFVTTGPTDAMSPDMIVLRPRVERR